MIFLARNTEKGGRGELNMETKKECRNIRKIADGNMIRNEDIKKQCKQQSLAKVKVWDLKQL